jgi:Mechanosensitive ion channel, conserved TM helix
MNLQGYWNQAQQALVEFGPKLAAAVAILVAAFVIAKLLAYAVRYLVNWTGFGGADLASALGRAVFWVTILIALPAVLGSLGMEGLLAPMQEMSSKFLNFLPNLIGAGLIFGIGFMVAKVAREAVTSVLQAAQFDALADRMGLTAVTGHSDEEAVGLRRSSTSKSSSDTLNADISSMETQSAGLSGLIGTLVFTLLIIPVAIAALDTLGIESISTPAKQMLQSVLDAIPNIFAAAIVLALAYFIGRFAGQTAERLLPATGVDTVGDRLGLSQEVHGGTSISRMIGAVAFAAIVIFGIIEAAKLLNFSIVSNLLTNLLELGGRILLGSAIIAFGVIVADFVSDIVARSKDAERVAPLLKIAIIVLAVAMGLRQMGLANEIINIGFTLVLGALAVGAAIAIGLGGKDTAGRVLDKWTRGF